MAVSNSPGAWEQVAVQSVFILVFVGWMYVLAWKHRKPDDPLLPWTLAPLRSDLDWSTSRRQMFLAYGPLVCVVALIALVFSVA